MKNKVVYIKGMHCVSCEKLLEDELKDIPGIKTIKADRQEGILNIGYEEKEPEFSEISQIVTKYGYTAYRNNGELSKNKDKNSAMDWFLAVAITAILIMAYQIFQATGFGDKIGVVNANIGYGAAFLIGLVASVSSCLAVVGSVVIIFSENYKSGETGFWNGVVRPNLIFHVGRLGGFFLLGGLLGYLGGEINLSGNFIAIYTIIIAIVMAVLGLNILGIFPKLSSFGFRMPKKVDTIWNKLKTSKSHSAPLLLGVMTFFLPCGFTQSMQLLAIASGSFWRGGISLFLFALGTLPTLLALGVSASWTKNSKFVVFQKVAGFLVLIFALYTFNSGRALFGVSENVFSNAKSTKQVEQKQQPTGEKQTVEMHVTTQGFEPNVLKLKKGVPVRWVIKGDNITGCTSKIIVPSLNISQPLVSGDNIVEFTPQKAGEIPFSCWMGMVRGKFIVE